MKKYPLMLHQACLNPYSLYCLSMLKLMPMDQFLLYFYAIIMVYSNFYLYRFLRTQAETNKESKILRNHQNKNFVPARTGFVFVFVIIITTVYFNLIYSFEYWTGNKIRNLPWITFQKNVYQEKSFGKFLLKICVLLI